MKLNQKTGFILVEVLVAAALFAIVFVILLNMGFLALNISASIQKETQADSLIKEEFEALRNYRDKAITWTGLFNSDGSTPYYLTNASGSWVLTFGTETVGIFTRQIVFSSVLRDSDKNIVLSGGSNDPDTIMATITVAWPGKTLQAVSYFTNWQNND